jgi:hypothetical protein
MARSVLAAFGFVCLAVSMAMAQTNSYWLTLPPPGVGARLKPPPAPEIPNVPFAAARHVPVAGMVKIPQALKLIGPVAPLWLGPNAVALPVMRDGHLALMAWEGGHFDDSRVVADSSTIKGAAILDMAVNRDGSRVAIAADAAGQLQIWIRNTSGNSPASIAATIDSNAGKAGISWLGAGALAVGVEAQPLSAPSDESPITAPGQPDIAAKPAEPARGVYVVRPGEQQPASDLNIQCIDQIDPTNLLWSRDGSFAIARGEEHGPWTLIDRAKARCTTISLPGIIADQFVGWGSKSRSFLFTATPANSPDPAHIGVMEYTTDSHKARLLASPATAAAYVDGKIAVLGSPRLNAAALAANPGALFPAEIAWIDPDQSQLEILPAGFNTSAASLLRGYVSGSEADVLAVAFAVPAPRGAFTALLWMAPSTHNGGILGTGRIGTMVARWSPDGARLAVLSGLPDHPTLAVVARPH